MFGLEHLIELEESRVFEDVALESVDIVVGAHVFVDEFGAEGLFDGDYDAGLGLQRGENRVPEKVPFSLGLESCLELGPRRFRTSPAKIEAILMLLSAARASDPAEDVNTLPGSLFHLI